MPTFEVLVAGFLGGALRAYLGSRKYGRDRDIAPLIIVLGIVGAICAAAFLWLGAFPSMRAAALAAALAGYVGADVIEALYKIRARRGWSLS